jgi:hypothetical protein
MICFARSMRARRSSAVIGRTRSRIEASAARLGGSGPAGASPPRPRCADTFIVAKPAAAPVANRNDRRDSMMQAPSEA